MINLLKNSKFYFAVISLFLLMLIFERAFIGSNSWRYTHWLFNYDIEFVKRGFAGQILLITNYDMSFLQLEKVWLSITLTVSIIFSLIVARSFLLSKEKNNVHFFLLALISSATLQHFVYDFGRFDSINLIITMIALVLINKLTDKTLFLLMPALSLIMILVHEAAFFLFIPLIISYWLYIHPKTLFGKFIVFAFIIISTYLVSTKGLVDSMSLKEHHTYLEQKYETIISESSLNVLHRNLKDNIEFTAESIDKKRIFDHIGFFITFFPLFFILGKILLSISNFVNNKYHYYLIITACFTPLALYPLGEDHFRWWAIVITNLFLIISLFAYKSSNVYDKIAEITHKHKKMIIVTITLSIILGPLGNPSAYPFTLNQYFIDTFNL